MTITRITPQLRTTDVAASIRFYVETLGFVVEFEYEDFYAGIRCGPHGLHLKRVDAPDPSIRDVEDGGHLHLYFSVDDIVAFADDLKAKRVEFVEDVHETAWQTREFVIRDDQGHTLYFGEPL